MLLSDNPQERQQSEQLRRMRRFATGLLVVMAVVFVLAKMFQERYGFLAFFGAFAEAAMVGALADWFAVTALFRRPLGLPIPHTAIIPNNKDRIGASVANFLEHNFMTREVLSEELRGIDFAGAASAWLAAPENSGAVSRKMVRAVPAVIRMVEDDDVSSFMQTTLTRGLQNVKFGPMLAELCSVLIADRRHQMLFDYIVGMAARLIDQNQPFIRQKIHENSPRWLPRMVDEKLFERLIEAARTTLEEMRQEDSEWRGRFQQKAQEFIDNLRHSPDYEARIKEIMQQALHNPLYGSYTRQVWFDIRERILADIESPESHTVAQLDRALRGMAEALRNEPVIQDKLNQWIRVFAADAIASRRHVIADIVKRVIQKWDASTVSRKFELYVGKDLQYIRINGTIVGGLVGLLLYSVSLWL
jgi:uncharacterized membrane-anchored protein YjiN (DUF445 family)